MSHSKADRDATRRRFDEIAATYDDGFVRALDRYRELHEVLVDLAARLVPDARRILDLGTGTGRLAALVLERLPEATVHGVDFSDEMLRRAKEKLSVHADRFTFQVADLASFDPAAQGPWDAIVSALAIHHIDDADKSALTVRVRRALRPGGAFLNGDLVRGGTDLERRLLEQVHIDMMREGGLDEEAIQERLRRHCENDIPATIRDQLAWLEEAGFAEVWLPWRRFHQAVTVGLIRTPASG